MSSLLTNAKFEHTFWLQILGDHSRFILSSLSQNEKQSIQIALELKEAFDSFLQEARDLQSDEAAINLANNVEPYVMKLKNFKLDLIKRHLVSKISIHLSPSFLNHMVNELEEYERILGFLKIGEKPPIFHELHHHLLWLQDAYGHAGAINDEMDATEKRIKKSSAEFVKHFEQFYLKAVELTGYLRTQEESFPALKRFNSDVQIEMEMFQFFLNEIFELDLSDQLLGTFPVLMADHMFREECYYLTKLAESTNIKLPECDPTKPRYEE
ncbi:DUF2935 domain-containing protein [Heyndrickxia oleronia]|uniref:DUF2935 domain-containing protein n=1 Tax=Heyndrickxia oleronia TaxID=38875 RepID=A0AAW6SUN0_9BACI|nr:DUF2935 domain-containing protein [Heyndrickxia oleronia]MDH5159696.1 DUF2935 domain-containing protein [Heyndrickxia oleronia]